MNDVIVIDELDPKFKYEVANEHGGEHIMRCFQCGTCTASCPVSELSERYNPRKIIKMILLGMRNEVLSSDAIWLCSDCYTCTERCPQDVGITEIMNAVKNIAVREGYILPAREKQWELLNENGKVADVDDFGNKKRAKLGLPEIKPAPKEEIAKMLSLVKLQDGD